MIASFVRLFLVTNVVFLMHAEVRAFGWKAGVAAVKITPEEPIWMSGYGNRTKRAEGTVHHLRAKALALQDAGGHRAVLVTLDLCGIDRDTSLAMCEAIREKYGLKHDQVALNCSHTHCGPVVGRYLPRLYSSLGEAELRRIDRYTTWLSERIVAVVGEAIEELAPATLAWGEGHADFAVNRRENRHDQVVELRKKRLLKGPVDHSVPVLRVTDRQGQVTAIVFGYACHPTKLSGTFYRWCGDYVGFAQLQLEQDHPGTVAMFWQGCCGDQTPWPRGGDDVEKVRAIGTELAEVVEDTLGEALKQVEGRLVTRYREVKLPLGELPSRSELESMAKSRNQFTARHATELLETLDSGKTPAQSYVGYPVQVWRIGPELLFIALGGEVVVDYAIRLKDELGPTNTWVAGYTNDVPAYIPSHRVLQEGGYEGASSMIYYGLPTTWAPEIEETIVNAVRTLLQSTGKVPTAGPTTSSTRNRSRTSPSNMEFKR